MSAARHVSTEPASMEQTQAERHAQSCSMGSGCPTTIVRRDIAQHRAPDGEAA